MNLRKWLLSANLYSFSANNDSLRLVDKSYFCFMNEKITNTINKMLPPELEKAKKLIESLLEVKSNERLTNLEYLERKKIINCPLNKTHHMNFIRYRKILKYTIEYLDTNETMFVDTVLLDIDLKSNDVYSTDMPFDVDSYKEWYSNRHIE